jgi:hypothetical protein
MWCHYILMKHWIKEWVIIYWTLIAGLATEKVAEAMIQSTRKIEFFEAEESCSIENS